MMRKLLLLAACTLLARSLSAQTADEVVNSYIEARGGLAKIKAVKTQRVTGSVSFGPGAEGPFLVEHERPFKLHTELTINDQTMIRTYDGKKQGWVYNPFTPNPSVQPMSAADLAAVYDEADFDGPFVDYKSKGNQLEFVDKEEVLGKTAYKIKLTNKSGDVSSFFFDAETHLLLKWEGTRKIADHNVPWEEFFHDFREVKGLKYAFLIESEQPGTDQVQKIVAAKIEVNVPIDEARFGKPNPPPSTPPPSDTPAQSAKPN
jgi:outer membrane lipoprotein-sorting protein